MESSNIDPVLSSLAAAAEQNISIDPQLIAINTIVNKDREIDRSISFQLTLIVQGSIISGELIPESLYFSTFNQEVSDLKIIKFINKMCQDTSSLLAEQNTGIDYLYLKNVSVQQSNDLGEPIKLPTIRISLRAVGAFSLSFQQRC